MVNIGIIGATGYTGLELLKLLSRHPLVTVSWLTSESSAGRRLRDVFPLAPAWGSCLLRRWEEVDLGEVDLVFCCLPHAAAQAPVAAARGRGAKVVDLSADFRLRDPAVYESWYAHPHQEPALLAEAVYGLPELYRNRIRTASLVANPGCYPTTVILGLAPLAQAGWLAGVVVADSKSGVSGAGRQPSLKTHFVEVHENLSPYAIGRSHRHLPEMEQELAALSRDPGGFQIIFSPHLAPVNRGIVSTIYASLPPGIDEAQVRERYEAMYAAEPFVRVLAAGQAATLAHVVHTNYCVIGLTVVPQARTVIVTVSIDNLIKGASGQAVQNMNLMLGCEETLALI